MIKCELCEKQARWSICNMEGDWPDPVVRWFACGRHLHRILAASRHAPGINDYHWTCNAVQIYDLEDIPDE